MTSKRIFPYVLRMLLSRESSNNRKPISQKRRQLTGLKSKRLRVKMGKLKRFKLRRIVRILMTLKLSSN